MWLIQRGTIRNAGADLPMSSKGIDSLVRWDYMGSAEYEFGALFKSLKAIREDISDYGNHYMAVCGKTICVFCKIKAAAEVGKMIVSLSKNPPRLKEVAEFDLFCGNPGDRFCTTTDINFWWDIDNHFMFWQSVTEDETIVKAIKG